MLVLLCFKSRLNCCSDSLTTHLSNEIDAVSFKSQNWEIAQLICSTEVCDNVVILREFCVRRASPSLNRPKL